MVEFDTLRRPPITQQLRDIDSPDRAVDGSRGVLPLAIDDAMGEGAAP